MICSSLSRSNPLILARYFRYSVHFIMRAPTMIHSISASLHSAHLPRTWRSRVCLLLRLKPPATSPVIHNHAAFVVLDSLRLRSCVPPDFPVRNIEQCPRESAAASLPRCQQPAKAACQPSEFFPRCALRPPADRS